MVRFRHDDHAGAAGLGVCVKTISQMKPTKRKGVIEPSESRQMIFDLTAARTSAGLSVRDVAKQCGVSSATQSRVERGGLPDIATALRLAAFYEKRVEDIWKLRTK